MPPRVYPCHEGTIGAVAISENRKAHFDEIQRQWFFEDTQPASEVLRRRLREFREAKEISQRALANAMTEVGVPLTVDKVSKIETGARRVRYDELLAFAHVLNVPLARLMSPQDGEPPIRAGGTGLERHEVANWLVWGHRKSPEAMSARKIMRLTREIQTMCQVVLEEHDRAQRKAYGDTLERLVKEVSAAAGIRPGIMKRQALRDSIVDNERKPQ